MDGIDLQKSQKTHVDREQTLTISDSIDQLKAQRKARTLSSETTMLIVVSGRGLELTVHVDRDFTVFLLNADQDKKPWSRLTNVPNTSTI